MQRPLIYSALLHLTVLIFLWIGFYNPFEKAKVVEQPLMIEFVQVGEQSAAPHLAPEIIQKAEPTPLPPKPAPPSLPKPEARPAPAPPAPPTPPKPEPVKPQPQPVEQPKPMEAEPVPDPKAKPKPETKPIQEKPKPQKVEITLDKKKRPEVRQDEKNKDIKKKLEVSSKDDQAKDKKKKPSKSFEDILKENDLNDDGAPSQGKGAPASKIGPVVTASEIDAIRQRIYKCWIVPAGARGARDMEVDIDLDVARDGTVTKAVIVNKARVSQDPFFRSAAESARRAVMDPRCNPLPIPAEKYDQFKHFTFVFNPKDMY